MSLRGADLASWTRLEVAGSERTNLLQRISTNDLRALPRTGFLSTVFVTPKGRIVDRALVLDLGDRTMLVAAPGSRERLPAWIRRYVLNSDVQVRDVTEETAAFGLVGADARGCLEAGHFGVLAAPFHALPESWILVGPVERVEEARRSIAGNLLLLSPEELEVLRIEAGIPWEGRELTEDWNPWEAGLDADLAEGKGCYTGQEVIARLKTYEKVQRRLAGISMGAAEPPRVPAPIRDASGGGVVVGTLTSAVRSRRAGATIGLGYLSLAHHRPEAALCVGDAVVPARVAVLPFVPPESA